MKKQLLVAGAVTTLGLAGLTGITVANAATEETSDNPMSSLVAKIAEKFNLNQDEVQAVFDEQRDAMQAEREADFAERLSQAVTDGDLTQEQADKITAKRAELQEAREANKDKTGDERREAIESERDALKTWAEENDIDLKWLMPGGGHGHGGPGGFGGPREESSDSSESTDTTN